MAVSRCLDARLDDHRRVGDALSALTDEELVAKCATVGAAGVVDVESVPVFVKRLALTDLERDPEAAGSTVNLFGLPAHCHFGVGSPGFGAWRELAATSKTSSWVSNGAHEGFPLLHHWRVLPGPPPPADEFRDVERVTAFWHGHPAMRDRLRSLAAASASLTLFLEHVPHTLAAWLADHELPRGASPPWIETQLLGLARFAAAHGLIHFDAHFNNVLTDGQRLYLADLGLAATTDFTLSDDEIALLEHAGSHDAAYARMRLVGWAVSTFGDPACARDPAVRQAHVRAYAAGAPAPPLPEPAAGIVRRHARVASVLDGFYAELFTRRRDGRYPAEDILVALRRPLQAP